MGQLIFERKLIKVTLEYYSVNNQKEEINGADFAKSWHFGTGNKTSLQFKTGLVIKMIDKLLHETFFEGGMAK